MVIGGCGEMTGSVGLGAQQANHVLANIIVWKTPACQLVALIAYSWGRNNYQDRSWVLLVMYFKRFVKSV